MQDLNIDQDYHSKHMSITTTNFPDSFSKLDKVLYVGIGHDYESLEELAERHSQVVGIDKYICDTPHHVTKREMTLERYPNLSIRQMDDRKLKFPDGYFGAVIFKKSLGFIGGGRVTKIFLQGLKNKLNNFSQIVVCDTNLEVLNALQKQFPGIQITEDVSLSAGQEVVFIALHPPVIMETLDKIKVSMTENTLVVSLAPKITIDKIIEKLEIKSVARMIPNATSYVNKGYNPLCFSNEFSTNKKTYLYEMLDILGNAFEVEESKLEAYAIISAMLPTYFWFQWEELKNVGLKMGLDESECKETIQETLKAAIQLYYNSGLSSEEVIDLIPVKPIAEHETIIKEFLSGKLIPLFEKIKP